MSTMLRFVMANIMLVFPAVHSSCVFPARWRDPVRWFQKYDSLGTFDYWLADIREDAFTWLATKNAKPTGITLQFICENSLVNETHFIYTASQPLFGNIFCGLKEELTNVMLTKHKTMSGYSNVNQVDVNRCREALEEEGLNVWTKFPFDTAFQNLSCPFRSGDYIVEYATNGGPVQCSGDTSSRARVHDGVLYLSSCYDGADSYATPMSRNLSCIDMIPSNLYAAGGDDIVILGDPQDPQHPKFYCARYREDGDVLSLSLYTGKEYEIDCFTNVTSQTNEHGYTAFTLTYEDASSATTVGDVPTPSGPAPNIATPVPTTIDIALNTTNAAPSTAAAGIITTASLSLTTRNEAPNTTHREPSDSIKISGVETTAAIPESPVHIRFNANGDYDVGVEADVTRFQSVARAAIADAIGIDEGRVVNIEAQPGIIIDFDIVASDSSAPDYVSVSEAAVRLNVAVDRGQVEFYVNNETVLYVILGTFSSFWPSPDGPCSSSPCPNHTMCVARTISLYSCSCPDGFTGDLCHIQAERTGAAAAGAADTLPLLISVCTLAAVIMAVTAISLLVCRSRRAPMRLQEEEGERQFTFARSWTPDYSQFGSSTLNGRKDRGNLSFPTMMSDSYSHNSTSALFR